ncbi:S41 family peptidase [Desertivirga xinjiangensis]|uniref:S41 family peptidase n=1 Tax=Desertivirga xinjiangensis TaxID=539206 RepID=UPI00210D92DF|nr:S41 family peptidase [Pedobacter xinjiangensis]
MKRLFFHFAIVALFTLKSIAQTAEKSFSSDLLREELKMMKTTLAEAHPGLDVFGQRQDLLMLYNEIDRKLAEKSEWTNIEFYRIANRMIAGMQDCHMKFLPGHKYYPFFFRHTAVFPFIVRFDDKNQLVVAAAQDQQYKGKLLKSINGRPIGDIVADLTGNMYVDGKSTAAREQVEQYFSAWYADYLDLSDEFQVELSDHQGSSERFVLKGIDYAQWKKLDSNLVYLEQNLSLRMLDDNVAFLRIPNFMTGKKTFRKFLRKSFGDIKKSGTEQLIIDLRSNEGGNDREGMDLYRYLAKDKFRYYKDIKMAVRKVEDLTYSSHTWFPFPKILKVFIRKNGDGGYRWTLHKNFGTQRPARNAFGGNVWILQDGLSMSATTEFLSRVVADKRATLIGTETSGAYKYDFSGTFLFLNLPHTKITMANPMALYTMEVSEIAQKDRGIIPAFELRRSAAGILKSKDEQLETVLNKIKVEKVNARLQ